MRIAYAASLITLRERNDAREILIDSTMSAIRTTVRATLKRGPQYQNLARAHGGEETSFGADFRDPITEFAALEEAWIDEYVQAVRRHGIKYALYNTIQ